MHIQEPAVMCTFDHKNDPVGCDGECWHCTHNVDYLDKFKDMPASVK